MLRRFKLLKVVNSYLIACGVWASVFLLLVLEHPKTLGPNAVNFYDLEAMAFRFLSITLLTPPVFYLAKRIPFTLESAKRVIVAYAVGVVLFNILFVTLRWTIAPLWDPALHRYLGRSFSTFSTIAYGTFADMTWVYLEIVLAANALLYFQATNAASLERAELQQALATSELQVLKAQIHPHLIFNVLHGIATLIDTDARHAKAMVIQVSSLLRTALEHGSSDLVTLSEELKFIASYLELEKMRLGSRLVVLLEIAPETRECLVPQLVLQPLVENAIVHGIACTREGGWVEISSVQSGTHVHITVRNSLGAKHESGTGIGLSNTRNRLKYLYGDDATLRFTAETNLATAIVSLPSLGTQHSFGKIVTS